MSHFLPNILRVILLSWLCAACTGLPVENLRFYAEAFQETRAAGNVLLDKVAPIIMSVEQRKGTASACAPDQYGIPRCFDNQTVRVGVARTDPPSIAVRRVALDMIALYNSILIDLAEGKSVAEVQGRVGEMLDLATLLASFTGVGGELAVLVPAIRPQLMAFIARFEAARAQEIARESIIANKETIQALLRALEADTPLLFKIYRIKRTDDRRLASLNNDAAGTQAAIDDMKNFYASLTQYVVLSRKTSKALDTLAETAAQPPQVTPQNLTSVIKEAVEIRAEAKKFWETIRLVQASTR